MSYMRDADGNRLDEISIKRKLSIPKYSPNTQYAGPVSTDNPTVTTGVAVDAAFNKNYAVTGGALPANWPLDAWGKMVVAGGQWLALTSDAATGSVATYRFMYDGSELMLFTAANALLMDLYIDGKPYASNPIALATSAGFGSFGLTKMVFGSATPRLIEYRTLAGTATLFAKNPYRMWKPGPDINPKVAVVGDSWVYPTTLSDTLNAAATPDPFLRGAYQRMPALLGITSLATDGVGATGYIADAAGAEEPFGGSTRLAWLQTINPDVIIVHGGGMNDLFYGNTTAATITAATTYFTTLRTNHPNAKLVFVEGFTPPGFTPATYNPNAVIIRQGVQTNLAAAGVGAYFLDVATTQPAIYGTGYVTAGNANDNSSIYVGSDSYHLSARGAAYVRQFLHTKIGRILADNGDLVDELI